jgi:hypothetical protein
VIKGKNQSIGSGMYHKINRAGKWIDVEDARAYAAAVSAAKDAEIAGLRAVVEKLVDWNKASHVSAT